MFAPVEDRDAPGKASPTRPATSTIAASKLGGW
jgi:hypothetical protein